MSRSHPQTVRRVREARIAAPPALVHPGWREAFPWLVQGTTTRGSGPEPFDLGLFSGGSPREKVVGAWRDVIRATRCSFATHARQVHGADVRLFEDARTPPTGGEDRGWADGGPRLAPDCDGHATDLAGVLLAVTVADCVPVFMVDARRRAIAIVHAGWRGTAAGVLESGVEAMNRAYGSRPDELWIHLGPSICGRCYEVGPEVFERLGQPVPAGPTPIDLRAVLAQRAHAAGTRSEQVSVSTHCTRCTDSALFSHRGGDAGRQIGYLAISP